jgi:hypothetical protein
MERTSVVLPSVLAAAGVLAIELLYVTLVAAQGGAEPGSYVPHFVSGYLVLMAVLIVIALIPNPRLDSLRVPLRAAASGGLLVLGILAAASFGLPVVVAGLLAGFALTRTKSRPAQWWAGAAASLVSVAVLLAGFQLTEGLFF